MSVRRDTSFPWLRFLGVALLVGAVAVAAVEGLSPERRFGTGTVAAEVTVRVMPRLAPTADAIRRRMLSTENLRHVAVRLRGEMPAASISAEFDDEAVLERWRRDLAVEVHPTNDLQQRRIRFLAPVAGRPQEAAALVETVASQYAGSLAAERWYGAIDRLRSAEAEADATFEKLVDLLKHQQTALLQAARQRGVVARTVPVAPRNLVEGVAASPVAVQTELDRELFRLVQQRATLLETLQPAHPQVAALDARLNALRTAAATNQVRRLGGEEPLPELTLPGFDDAPTPTLPTPTLPTPTLAPPLSEVSIESSPAGTAPSPAVDDAIRQWQASRTTVKACLDDLLAPAAAEFPVVTTVVSGLNLWDHHSFWQIAAVTLGLLAGAVVSLPRRGGISHEAVAVAPAPAPIASGGEPKQATIELPTPVPAATAFTTDRTYAMPHMDTSPRAPVPQDDVVHTVEQAAAAVGGPVLGVLVRRRESPSGVA